MAGITLKTFVLTNWENEECSSPHAKIAIRDITLQGLTDSNQQMRNIFAYIVAKVAEEDFPTKWPELLDYLIRLLQSDCAITIDGAIKALSELLKSGCDFGNQEIERLIIEVMPMLTLILERNKHTDSCLVKNNKNRKTVLFFNGN